jgi:hypothetical protein
MMKSQAAAADSKAARSSTGLLARNSARGQASTAPIRRSVPGRAGPAVMNTLLAIWSAPSARPVTSVSFGKASRRKRRPNASPSVAAS